MTGSICTLACCKPRIRAKAQYGDWIAGVTPKEKSPGRLIYLMRVERAFTFAEYHSDMTFRGRPDNIYRPKVFGGYVQERNDFHGLQNVRKDLSADRVLASNSFVYFGERAPTIPAAYRNFVPRGQGHRVYGSALGEPADPDINSKIRSFVRWAFSRGKGINGHPFDSPQKHHDCSV